MTREAPRTVIEASHTRLTSLLSLSASFLYFPPARTLRRAVFAYQRRENLSARLRRSVTQVRQGWTGLSLRCCCRPYRPRATAHPLRPIFASQYQLFHRILRARPYNARRRVCRRHRTQYGRWYPPPLPCAQNSARNGRVWACLLQLHERAHMFGRR